VKHAFSIDLEDWYHGIEIPRSSWGEKEKRLEIGLETILRLLDEHAVKATFFTLGCIGERYPQLIRKVAEQGHEIACHSFYHEKVYDLSPAEFKEDTQRAKGVLENLSGKAVNGYRAPYFSITEKSLWALEVLCELGFQYDCSISPVVTWRYGIKDSPENIYAFKEFDLVEFPLTTFKFLGRKWGTGGAYLRIFPVNKICKAGQKLEQNKQPLMFYAHPWEYDPEHPKVSMEFKAKLTHYHGLGKMKDRTEELLKKFPFGTVDSVLQMHQAAQNIPKISVAAFSR